ncbi:sialidase family protein [Gemmata sp. JC717]|uniref:sialidase family protein n=1 Tax=Gemmata algarum TaxID=2975278 RepID=UPI0021BAFD33|nr:sialidase family protein [Gemmata algarum]MDY3557020.1 sialidase family protein [Gemmata algarum]
MLRFLPVLALALCGAPATAAEPEKIDVFAAGTGGYAMYRIPGIVVTQAGTALAYCEARKTGSDWATIDILLRRSTDGGKTWDDPKKVADVKGPKERNPVAVAKKLGKPDDVTYNNPVMIADRSGAVHLLFCLEYMRCFYSRSGDDGRTWSEPAEITATAFEPLKKAHDWKVIATGPGHGIQLKGGRLVVPVWLALGTGGGGHGDSVAATIYSDDGGKTWKPGEVAAPRTADILSPNESTVCELADGSVMFNARSPSKPNRRLVTVSADGATKWSQPTFDDALPEPLCMGSLLSVPGTKLVLFSNPDNLEKAGAKSPPAPGTGRDRKNLTVRLSDDSGKTWAAKRSVEAGFSAYSDLALAKDGTVLLFYERADEKGTKYGRLTFTRFPVEWVRGK